MTGIVRMVSYSHRIHHPPYVSQPNQAVARSHLLEEVGELIATDWVMIERANSAKHIRGKLEQLGWSKDEQGSSALSLIRIRIRSYSFAHRSLSLSSFYIRVIW